MYIKLWHYGYPPIKMQLKDYMVINSLATLEEVKAHLERRCYDFEDELMEYEFVYTKKE